MRKAIFLLFIVMLLTLSACVQPTIDNLEMSLNPGVDTIEIGKSHVDTGAQASYGLRLLTIEVIKNNVDTNQIGVYEIIYQATYSNLVKTITRMVTVIDEAPPVISLNPGVDTIFVGETWIDAGVEAVDASGGEVTLSTEGEVLSIEGEYVITYIATDESGNTSQIQRYVSVITKQTP
ncbi:MAG: DUF5011 domain-containing protein [Tenericutes bacterium]|nr:DUF5011 domain-containing protein [Mycoplasmatota bacterium]